MCTAKNTKKLKQLIKRLLPHKAKKLLQYYHQDYGTKEYKIDYIFDDGAFDNIRLESSGLIIIEGWSRLNSIKDLHSPTLYIANEKIPVHQAFRSFRKIDNLRTGTEAFLLHGVNFTYKVPPHQDICNELILKFGEKTIFKMQDVFQISVPHYEQLLDETDAVLHREDIYGSGPPSQVVCAETISLGKRLIPPILDFGCGSGALVKILRDQGIEAYGLELDQEPILSSLSSDAKQHITLYDGEFPLPFQDEAFNSVIAAEVVEHIPKYEEALSEISRITKHQFIITIPDMSSIPLCYHNGVVPWHLLESTHVNFFTQSSLNKLLKKYFAHVEFAKINPVIINNSKCFGSIVGICRK